MKKNSARRKTGMKPNTVCANCCNNFQPYATKQALASNSLCCDVTGGEEKGDWYFEYTVCFVISSISDIMLQLSNSRLTFTCTVHVTFSAMVYQPNTTPATHTCK